MSIARDWRELALEAGGRSLIEASAGTGKTWTISVLYLRLLLERGLGPAQIVVTTFTDAAAQELRERLRQRLAWAIRLAGGSESGNAASLPADQAWLQQRWQGEDAPARRRDLIRLQLAEAELDLAPIGTLHGLCRRILRDYPFECGSAFGACELIAGQGLDRELIDDLWRELAQSPGELGAGAACWFERGRERFGRALRSVLSPGVEVRPIDDAPLRALLAPEHAARLRDWLAAHDAAFKSKTSVLRRGLAGLADFIEGGDLRAELPVSLPKDLAAPLEKQIKPALLEGLRDDPLLRLASDAADLLDRRLAPAAAAFLADCRSRLQAIRRARLDARGQLSFDALIERVHAALGEPGSELGARLCAAWPVALVDEFQDTDALQYGILDRIYCRPEHDADPAPRGRLVMIGDPKQAIYRFRGGDIQTYRRARASADQRLHLDTNFRSASRYVAALNALFGAAGRQLGQDPAVDIVVEDVAAGPRTDTRPYSIDGAPCARPLVFHLDPDPPRNKPARCAAALTHCANTIVDLLAGGDRRIGDEPLVPGDIAVLLPDNAQIEQMRALLQARRVPCVGAGRSSVFSTDVARELQLVLYAVEHSGNSGALRAAVATRLYGIDFAGLQALADDVEAWQAHIQRFARWRQLWQRRGVLAVVGALIRHGGDRLLAAGDGERLLTDLRHLGELLQTASEACEGSAGLLAWLQRQRGGDAPDGEEAAEERQLRIESDARRVRLMTLHASKGLEFPLVMLPLMWAHDGRRDDWPLVWDEASGRRLLDLGSAGLAAARQQVQAEDQDERFRVLYVALTRARHACHLFALPPGRPQDGRIANAPSDPQRSALDALLARLAAAGRPADDGIEWRHESWPQVLVALPAEAAAGSAPRHVLAEPPAAVDRQRYSFSALTQPPRQALAEEQPADDEAVEDADDTLPAAAAEPAPMALMALAGYRGTEFGNALHAVLENRRIGQPLGEQLALVRRSLEQAGVRPGELGLDALALRLAHRLDGALEAELLPGLRLAALPADALRAEMEFHFELAGCSLQALAEACAAAGEPALIPPGAGTRLRGMMTGKIDLVLGHSGRFHVLDYKGNWLGESLQAYSGSALPAAMDAHHYRFQALLYTLALERYLRGRLPGYRRAAHLGEAIYLFVRAAGLAADAGVWHQRFDDRLLDAVDAAFGGAVAGEPLAVG
jgi:exodeoxyribonuclease V beta subunit